MVPNQARKARRYDSSTPENMTHLGTSSEKKRSLFYKVYKRGGGHEPPIFKKWYNCFEGDFHDGWHMDRLLGTVTKKISSDVFSAVAEALYIIVLQSLRISIITATKNHSQSSIQMQR